MLFIMPTMLNSQSTSDSLFLEITPMELVQSNEHPTELLAVKRGNTTVKSGFTESTIAPETSYFNAFSDSSNEEKAQSALRASATTEVGEIAMSTEVSPNGSMTVNVPIELSMGAGDLTPSIALTYNSLSGIGVAGSGWHINGLFPISYRNKSIHYDGKVSPESSTDLCWGGRRLIYVPSSGNSLLYPKSVSYKLEGSEATITAEHVYSNNEMTIYDNQGAIYLYKYDSNNVSFRLIKITDRHGNYIDYSYRLHNNIYYIEKISYGGNKNKNTSHTKTVDFSYEISPNQMIYFQMGKEMNMNLRLKTITTDSREYTLSHSYNRAYYGTLSEINCRVTNGSLTEKLKPLRFFYGEGISSSNNLNKEEGSLHTYFANGNYNNLEAVSGLFSNNSNEEGFVVYPKKNAYQQGSNKTLHSGYSPNDVVLISPTYTDATYYNSSTYTVKANEGFRGLVTLNADNLPGNSEIVLINSMLTTGSKKQSISFRIFSYAGLAAYGVTKTVNLTLDTDYSTSVTPIFYHTGNFKGDGIDRIIGIQPKLKDASQNSVLYLFDLKTENYYRYNTPFTMEDSDEMITLDYDGDAKTDLYHFHKTGFDIYSFVPNDPASSANLSFSLEKVASSTTINRSHFNEETKSNNWTAKRAVLFGDINGDGKMDILKTPQYGSNNGLLQSKNGNKWIQLLAAGNGTFKETEYTISDVWLNTYNDVFMHDFNGDGRSDVVCLKNNSLQIIYSTGTEIDGWYSQRSYPIAEIDPTGKLFTIGINHSNHNRVLGYIKDGKIMKLSIDENQIARSYLTSAITSHNVRTNISYQRIDDRGSNCYSAGSGAVFPFENYNGSFWVVSNLNKQLGGNKILDLRYNYTNAIIHKQGLGFCGFEKILTSDIIANRATEVIYDPTHLGIVKQVDGYNQKIENTYDLSYTGNKEPKFRLTSQKMTDKMTGNVTTMSNSYDTYGNVTKSTTKYGSDQTEEVTIEYYNSIGSYGSTRIGFPLNTTTKVTRGNSTATSSIHHTYNAKQLPEKTIEKREGKIISQTLRVFDDFSNLTQESYIPYEATDKKLTSTFTYNSNGTKLTKSTNELGQATEYSYSGDLLSSIKDFRGNIVRYEYDASRRRIKQTNPDNTIIQTSYEYNNSDYYTVTETGTNRPTSKTQYDGLHRVVKEENQSISSTVYRKTEYDNRGRVSRVSLPSFLSSPSRWNTYSYDSFDRPKELNYASGKKDTYSYNGNNVTSIIDGITVTKTYDASGQLISVKDQAGTITYNLRADGQPSSIVAPGSVTTSFTYDNYGRKLTITDPSAGKQTYTYDNAGNIKSETDANNKTISYTYDEYSRLTQKVQPEFTTTYSYNSDGSLRAVSSNNGAMISYNYDSYGRLIHELESFREGFDTESMTKRYSYSDGRVSSVQYSTSNQTMEGIERYIYSKGHLSEITFSALGVGNTSIWKLNSVNEFGQPTNVKTGPINRTYGYNTYGFPTSRTANSFQNFTYSFDVNTGNLTYQKDNIKNYQEDYTYDKLNRLTDCSTGGVKSTISYNNNGNISNKSNMGYISYNTSGKPYAMSRANTSSGAVSSCDQSISYTSFKRPSSISEGEYSATFVYNGLGNRVKMDLNKNGKRELTRYYFSDCYEIDINAVGATREKLYLGGDYYSAPIVYIKDNNGSRQLYYICRDNLGSITHIANNNGNVVQQLSYDEWGRLRDWNTKEVYAPGTEPALFLGRGYTGHEHLTQFGLINMNARLYDPAVGRFLSPDPYVQMPDFSQSYNRYSYCLNNPLKYTDESGEIGWSIFNAMKDMFVNNYIKSWSQGINAWTKSENWHSTTMAWKIDTGLFKGDFNQVVSRFTKELPQTFLGYQASQFNNLFNRVKSVGYYDGATVVESYSSNWGAFTLGSYINGERGIEASLDNRLFLHEYGHYLQSQAMGWGYLGKVAIPSVISAAKSKIITGDDISNPFDITTHKVSKYERDANRRAAHYFAKKGVDWSSFYKYPIGYPDFSSPYDNSYLQISENGRKSHLSRDHEYSETKRGGRNSGGHRY